MESITIPKTGLVSPVSTAQLPNFKKWLMCKLPDVKAGKEIFFAAYLETGNKIAQVPRGVQIQAVAGGELVISRLGGRNNITIVHQTEVAEFVSLYCNVVPIAVE